MDVCRFDPSPSKFFRSLISSFVFLDQPAYIQQLHTLLQQSTAPDTNLIKAATAALNTDFYRDPKCIPGLFEIVASAPEQNIRQIASVELRKRVSQKTGQLWIQVPQEFRESIKTKLFEVVLHEQVPIVRHAISRVIAAIGEIELPTSAWPALLPWLNEMTNSPVATSREVGIYVVFTTMDVIMDNAPKSANQFITHFAGLLNDPESLEVRVTALRCLVTVAQYLETDQKTEIASFQSAVPAMLAVIGSAIQADRSEDVRHGVDGFETLLILETPLVSKHIRQVVEFFTTIGADRNIDSDIRVLTLNALSWVVKYKKSKIQTLALAKPILAALILVGAEEEPDDMEDEAPPRSAFRVIDSLATSLPPSLVFNPLWEIVKEYCASPDPTYRKSALTSLGLSVEGCSEYIRPQVGLLWPYIDAGFQDPAAIVRNAACVSFGCLCEWLPDEVSQRHELVVPVLMNLITNPETQKSACTALDAFLEVLSAQIIPYLEIVMTQLSAILQTGTFRVKSLAIGAIGSAAHAAGPAFKPYFSLTLERLMPFFQLTGEGEEQELRGIAMDCLGTLADAMGKDDFRPYFADTMTMAISSAEHGGARLKECSFLLYGVLARLFEKEFSPYLATVVPSLLASCSQAEHGEDGGVSAADLGTCLLYFLMSLSESKGFGTGTDEEGDDVDIDEISSVDAEKALEVNSAIAVEKEIAADSLGIVFAAVGSDFLPYVETSVGDLILILEHYYEGIRKSVVSSLFEFIKTFYILSEPSEWQPGAAVAVPLHDKVKELVNMIMPAIFSMWESEDDKSVASQICQNLAETIAKVGPGMVVEYINEICTYTLQILERKALCQQDPDQDDEEVEEGEQAEYESVLVSGAMDVVGALATVLGADFSTAFESFLTPIFKFYSKNSASSDRSASIGSLGEIITGLKEGVTPYTEALLTHLFKAFPDEEAEVRSNAAFATGALVENSTMDLTSHYMTILMNLRPLFEIPADAGDELFIARDNAVGCVARMMLKNMPPPQVEQVLPTLMTALPLKKDVLENAPLFKAFFYLFQNGPQVITPYIDQLLPVFAHVLDPNQPDQVGDNVRGQLIALVRALNAQFPDKVAAAGLQPFIS
ncbi:ARM repeat-containing protein [Clavulina sp. PMI_390]|nr:ARM repeat-containing protein [Clavulina sp. PMI_390]